MNRKLRMGMGRLLDDDGNVSLRFDNGASGVPVSSQIAAGEENALRIRVYGEKGGIDRAQEDPNNLVVKMLDQPRQYIRTDDAYAAPFTLSSFAVHDTRVPSGHPEGLLEVFGNIYRNFVLTVSAKLNGETPTAELLDFAQVDEGIRGMAFIENVVASNNSSEKWTKFVV